eukprot:6179403-Pleurochrysis_carterae.AAC.2
MASRSCLDQRENLMAACLLSFAVGCTQQMTSPFWHTFVCGGTGDTALLSKEATASRRRRRGAFNSAGTASSRKVRAWRCAGVVGYVPEAPGRRSVAMKAPWRWSSAMARVIVSTAHEAQCKSASVSVLLRCLVSDRHWTAR